VNGPAVAARTIVKRFGSVTALDGLSLTVERGQLVGILGWNAAGKTTLLRLIAGLIAADSGTMTVFGSDSWRDRSEVRNIVGYMPQSVGIDEFLSVEECIDLRADLCNVTGEARRMRAVEILRLTGLIDSTKARAVTLAPAMRRQLGLACALVCAPRVLLLDEPTAGLDCGARHAMLRIVRALVTRGITALWSSSHIDEMGSCDRMIVLHEGRVLLEGTPRGLAGRAEGLSRTIRGARRLRGTAVALRAQPGVLDADIRRGEIRILTDRPDRAVAAEPGTSATVVPPRLEDAVIGSLLEGRDPIRLPSPVPGPARATGGPALEVRDLCKPLAFRAAGQGLSFAVNAGEVFGLIGPGGIGEGHRPQDDLRSLAAVERRYPCRRDQHPVGPVSHARAAGLCAATAAAS
jgi:ABC-2 type transport system ATP-binding protein